MHWDVILKMLKIDYEEEKNPIDKEDMQYLLLLATEA